MNDYKKLNNYVTRLQTCETSKYEEIFTEFFSELTTIWSSKGVIRSLASKYKLDVDDVLSIASLKALDLVKSFDAKQGHFYHYLSTSISHAVGKEAKERSDHTTTISPFETSMEDDPNLIPFIPHSNAEDEAIELLQKESEQLRLLTHLIEKADDKCRQAVAAFSETHSFYGASKLLGIDNQTVQRRIEKVSKQFDSNEHGEISDYFTVLTTKATPQRGRRKVA